MKLMGKRICRIFNYRPHYRESFGSTDLAMKNNKLRN